MVPSGRRSPPSLTDTALTFLLRDDGVWNLHPRRNR